MLTRYDGREHTTYVGEASGCDLTAHLLHPPSDHVVERLVVNVVVLPFDRLPRAFFEFIESVTEGGPTGTRVSGAHRGETRC